MQIKINEDNLNKYQVLLNGRESRMPIMAANEEEGWIEIVDISVLAPIDFKAKTTPENDSEPDAQDSTSATKKIFGKVEIKIL